MAERAQQRRLAARAVERGGGAQTAGPSHRQLVQLAAALNSSPRLAPAAVAGRGAALPEPLKNGVEALSGLSMDHVRVHYDSARPAQLRAYAFAQGGDIHLAPGEERHLPHEAWHVVQQAQGRVRPTAQLKSGVAVNDDSGLEREAEAMGARALAMPALEPASPVIAASAAGPLQAKAVVQRAVWEYVDSKWVQIDGKPGGQPPTAAVEPGNVYNDETGILYEDVHDYAVALRDQALGTDDLPEDDSSSEYVFVAGEDSDEDENDEEAQPVDTADTSALTGGTEMDVEERRKLDSEALRKPLESSLLTKPSSRFPSHTMATSDKFKVGKVMGQRTQKSGPVTITLQTVMLWVNDKFEVHERPILVSGIVEPTKTTGRGGAPDPLSGYQVYLGGGQRPKASVKSERNTGAPDVERGHVMALELGGPDIPQNIVPQWAKFQGSGEWRRMEVAVLAKAVKLTKGQQLRYTVEIFYKDSGVLTPTLRTFAFPTGFKATTQIVEGKTEQPQEIEFHQGQAQDQTDQMLAERKMRVLDESDWDLLLSNEKKKPSRRKANPPAKRKANKLDVKANIKPKRGKVVQGIGKTGRRRTKKQF